ncbi:MAG: HDOD domain-containing protein [Proteobacteria bacterium]|nr:HDOD domain-containing protein [Pseudomonadota bacterium]MBU1611794.1 HDOD domain-containing protein [Pseudomonadota bacterium]
MSQRDAILKAVHKVEKMPISIQRAIALLNDPDADLVELAQVLEHDPGLTSNILRMANSSYFGGVRSITSVREAVVRMGAQHVFKLVMASGVAAHTSQKVIGYGLEPGALLEHSITVALAAEELGRQLSLKTPDHTFTAGLLSDIGKVVLGTFLEVDVQPILKLVREEGISFEKAEKAVLGISHDEVAAALLEFWGLPQPIINVVRYRLDPDAFEGVDLALDLVHVADILAKNTGVGLGRDGMFYEPSTAVADRLKVTTRILDTVLVEIMEHVAELKTLFIS